MFFLILNILSDGFPCDRASGRDSHDASIVFLQTRMNLKTKSPNEDPSHLSTAASSAWQCSGTESIRVPWLLHHWCWASWFTICLFSAQSEAWLCHLREKLSCRSVCSKIDIVDRVDLRFLLYELSTSSATDQSEQTEYWREESQVQSSTRLEFSSVGRRILALHPSIQATLSVGRSPCGVFQWFHSSLSAEYQAEYDDTEFTTYHWEIEHLRIEGLFIVINRKWNRSAFSNEWSAQSAVHMRVSDLFDLESYERSLLASSSSPRVCLCRIFHPYLVLNWHKATKTYHWTSKNSRTNPFWS